MLSLHSLSAERRVASWFGLALLLLVMAGVFTDTRLSQAADGAHWVDHTRNVIEQLDSFLLALRDVETGQHGFLLTGQYSFLRPCRASLSGAQQNVSQVGLLTADNFSQQRHVERLRSLVAQITDLAHTLEATGQSGIPPPLASVLDNRDEHLIESARLLGRQMRGDEYRLLHERSERLWIEADRTRTTLILAMASGVALLALAVVSLYRERQLRVRTGRALQKSEERHQLAVEGSGIGSWSWDVVSDELLWSKRCGEMFGVPVETVLRYDVFEAALHPEDRGVTRAAVNESVEKGAEFDVEYRVVWADGSIHWLRAKGRTSRNALGKAVRFEGIVIDIDDQKRTGLALQKSERRYSALFANKMNGMAHGRIITDLNGKPVDYEILQVNRAYELITGMKKAEMEGRSAKAVFPEMENHPFDFIGTYGTIAQNGGEIIFEVFLERFEQWLSIYAYSPEPGEFIAISTDITQQKRASEALRASGERLQQLAAELEQRVSQRTAELEATNHELEAFAYSVSHDLRAPLRGIDGFARILLEEYAPQLGPKPQRYLELVRNDARRMGHLVDDLLSFSRVGRQGLKREPVDVERLFRRVWAEQESDLEGRDVELVVGAMPGCTAEPAMLKQVWVNLLSNALKFSRMREHTRIEVGALPPEDGFKGVVYFVKDNGVGFDMRYAAKLFGVFQRLHRAEDFEGTGVGLAIVQRIVQRHGGEIRADSKPNGGATFYFTLDGNLPVVQSVAEEVGLIHA